MSAVRYHGVRKTFDTFTALHSLDLKVPDRSFMALLGPSGCGKTTALRILAGLDMPTERARPDRRARRDAAAAARPRRRHGVSELCALSAQDGRRQYRLSAVDPQGERADSAAKVSEVATTLEIDHLLDRRPRQLSGGQRQRVALARAIVRDPAAFLMDEPLSNLDARLRLTMRGEIKRLCQRLGATTLYVTHDQAEALTMADLDRRDERRRVAAARLRRTKSTSGPANRFVATFVGNPPMNVLKARSTTAACMLAASTVAARRRQRRAACAAAALTEIGMRPEDFSLVEPGRRALSRRNLCRRADGQRDAGRRARRATSVSSVRAGRGFTAPRRLDRSA